MNCDADSKSDDNITVHRNKKIQRTETDVCNSASFPQMIGLILYRTVTCLKDNIFH